MQVVVAVSFFSSHFIFILFFNYFSLSLSLLFSSFFFFFFKMSPSSYAKLVGGGGGAGGGGDEIYVTPFILVPSASSFYIRTLYRSEVGVGVL